MNAIVTKAYEEAYGGEEDPATVDLCVIPVTKTNRRTLSRLLAVLDRAKELGIPNPQVSGEIEAGWLENAEWEEAGLPTLDAVVEPLGYDSMELPDNAIGLEMSKAIIDGDGTFFVQRIDDFKPRSQFIKLERENAKATTV